MRNLPKFVKSCVSRFSSGALKVHTMTFGMWIVGYWPRSDFWFVLLGIITEFLGGFDADHVRFDLFHPYIEHLPTL